MKRYTFFILALLGIVILSCSKNENLSEDGVWVRINNSSGITLGEAQVGSAAYDNVTNGTTTGYKKVTEPIYAGFCTYRVNGQQQLTAGYGICGSPMPPAFSDGYYTFKVEPTAQGYLIVTVTKR